MSLIIVGLSHVLAESSWVDLNSVYMDPDGP